MNINRLGDPSHPYLRAINTYAIEKDPNLTWKAKGILTYFLTRPDGWEWRMQDIVARSKDGLDAVTAGLEELEVLRYVFRKRVRHKDGTLKGIEFWCFAHPASEDQIPEGIQPKTKKATSRKNSPKPDFPDTVDKPIKSKRTKSPKPENPKQVFQGAYPLQETLSIKNRHSNTHSSENAHAKRSKRTKPPANRHLFPAIFQNDTKFQEAWRDFLKYRSELGRPLTPSQKDRLAGQLVRETPQLAMTRLCWAISQGEKSPFPSNGDTPFDTEETRSKYLKPVTPDQLPTKDKATVGLFQDFLGPESRINGKAFALSSQVDQIVLWYERLKDDIELPQHRKLFIQEYPDVYSVCDSYIEWLEKQRWIQSRSIKMASVSSPIFRQFLQHESKRFNFSFVTGDRTN